MNEAAAQAQARQEMDRGTFRSVFCTVVRQKSLHHFISIKNFSVDFWHEKQLKGMFDSREYQIEFPEDTSSPLLYMCALIVLGLRLELVCDRCSS